MAGPPRRDQETQDLIRGFQTRRARLKKLRIAAATIGGIALVALVIVVVIFVTRGPGEDGDPASAGAASNTTTAGSASATTTTANAIPAATTTSAHATTTSGETTTTTSEVTTTSQATTTTHATTSTTVAPAAGLVVVIDPGHQARANSNTEPVGPGSSEMKAKVSSGTAGVVTGTPESELVLAVGLELRDSLASHGITVVMTRTGQDVDISNSQRAQIANDAGADLFVRIHADGSTNSGTSGIHVLYPASIEGWTDDISAASKQAAALAQKELIAATGARDLGIDARSDLSGFNWSDVPVILPEIGFMTNAAEDRLLSTADYRSKIVRGLTRAILSFLGVS